MRISINCIFIWTHFLHVHKALLKVSKHFHEHFRCVVRIFRYSCTMAENSFSMIVEIVNLYGKTRVKCTTGRVPSYDYTVFLRVLRKSVYFYRVLPYKMRISINCIFIRVLPVKTQHGYQNGPQNGPPNRTRIALNTRFVEVIRVWVHKNTVFYRVKWHKIVQNRRVENRKFSFRKRCHSIR